MTAYAIAFKAEVERTVRKGLKSEIGPLRKTVASQRAEIAALKRDVKSLGTMISKMAKAMERSHAAPAGGVESGVTPVAAPAAQRGGRRFVFHPEALVAKREALKISQKDMATLLGSSISSARKWEDGGAAPRAAQIERIRAVLAMGKREARARLSQA